jgi:hypothetical protein
MIQRRSTIFPTDYATVKTTHRAAHCKTINSHLTANETAFFTTFEATLRTANNCTVDTTYYPTIITAINPTFIATIKTAYNATIIATNKTANWSTFRLEFKS